MSRDRAYRLWIAAASGLSFASGAALWIAGERPFGMCGVVASLFHALWAIDLRTRLVRRWRGRAIVIPRLHHDSTTVRHG